MSDLQKRVEKLREEIRNHDWKYDELAGEVKELPTGRSFEVGKQLFKVASCVGCHKLDGEGVVFGPDLAKLMDKKHTTDHILRSILEPSKYIEEKFNTGPKPVDFVFHGGSGSSVEEIREAISYGVIKMNIDTDLQWAFWDGVHGFYKENKDYLQGQIGNPEGDDKPNKKKYDPRVWLRKGEDAFIARMKQAFEDLNNVNTLS